MHKLEKRETGPLFSPEEGCLTLVALPEYLLSTKWRKRKLGHYRIAQTQCIV